MHLDVDGAREHIENPVGENTAGLLRRMQVLRGLRSVPKRLIGVYWSNLTGSSRNLVNTGWSLIRHRFCPHSFSRAYEQRPTFP